MTKAMTMAMKISNWRILELEAGRNHTEIEITRMEAHMLSLDFKNMFWYKEAPITFEDILAGKCTFYGMKIKVLGDEGCKQD